MTMIKFPGFPKEPATNYWPYPKALNGYWHILTLSEQAALNYILRHTWGFKKNFDFISYSQFTEGVANLDKGCGIKSDTTLAKALKGLENKGFITRKRFDNQRVKYGLMIATSENGEATSENEVVATSENEVVATSENEDTIKDNTIDILYIYTRILDCWNSQEIIRHRLLTGKMKGAINGRLREKRTVEEICSAIENYAEILKGEDYYFKYRWTLQDFLARGIDKFGDLEIAKTNYSRSTIDGTHKSDNKAPEGKYERFKKR